LTPFMTNVLLRQLLELPWQPFKIVPQHATQLNTHAHAGPRKHLQKLSFTQSQTHHVQAKHTLQEAPRDLKDEGTWTALYYDSEQQVSMRTYAGLHIPHWFMQWCVSQQERLNVNKWGASVDSVFELFHPPLYENNLHGHMHTGRQG
jgi:hypothetical protein